MTKIDKKHFRFTPLEQFAVAGLLFAITAYLASSGNVADWERAVFDAIHGWPEALTPLFLIITQFGNVYVLIILAMVYLLKKRYHVVLRFFLTGTLAYLLSGLAKDLLGRPRPLELLLDVTYRDYLVRGPGFPSGHAAMATAIAFTIAHYMPKKYLWTAPALIIGVGMSRVYLGVHAPLDVVGGFAIGWAAYALFRNVRLHDIHRKRSNKPVKSLKKR